MATDDLRSYYNEKFHQLNELMSQAKWTEVGELLIEACSDQNLSAAHPIGLIRFCSTARIHIKVWNECLDLLEVRVQDNLHSLRGLKRNPN